MPRSPASASWFLTIAQRFLRAREGLAAIEFALIAPVIIVMFFGVVEGSNALSVNRRVSLAANTLADLASQETSLNASQVDDLFTGVEQIIGQKSIKADIRLVSLVLDPDTNKVVVAWSRDNAGGEPYAPGAEYAKLNDPSLLDADSSLIVGEVNFSYSSPLTRKVIGPINFAKMATRWPRRSARVEFCATSSNCIS